MPTLSVYLGLEMFAAETSDEGVTADDDVETILTERNVNKFAYDTIVPELSDKVRAHVEDVAETFTNGMESLSLMPNSPTLMNAGNEIQQLSACFVMSPDDDLSDIHETAKKAAEVFQSGGGVGYGFWQLRPYGDLVGSTGGIASGPITFMRTYDQLCETIAQDGIRRGAQMGIMRVSHPDVIEFIHAKNKDVSLAHTLRLNDPDEVYEPIYNIAYYKNVTDDVQGDEMLVEFADYFFDVLDANDIDVATVKAEAEEQMATNQFDGIDSLESVPDAIGELFVTMGEVTAREHAAIQCVPRGRRQRPHRQV